MKKLPRLWDKPWGKCILLIGVALLTFVLACGFNIRNMKKGIASIPGKLIRIPGNEINSIESKVGSCVNKLCDYGGDRLESMAKPTIDYVTRQVNETEKTFMMDLNKVIDTNIRQVDQMVKADLAIVEGMLQNAVNDVQVKIDDSLRSVNYIAIANIDRMKKSGMYAAYKIVSFFGFVLLIVLFVGFMSYMVVDCKFNPKTPSEFVPWMKSLFLTCSTRMLISLIFIVVGVVAITLISDSRIKSIDSDVSEYKEVLSYNLLQFLLEGNYAEAKRAAYNLTLIDPDSENMMLYKATSIAYSAQLCPIASEGFQCSVNDLFESYDFYYYVNKKADVCKLKRFIYPVILSVSWNNSNNRSICGDMMAFIIREMKEYEVENKVVLPIEPIYREGDVKSKLDENLLKDVIEVFKRQGEQDYDFKTNLKDCFKKISIDPGLLKIDRIDSLYNYHANCLMMSNVDDLIKLNVKVEDKNSRIKGFKGQMVEKAIVEYALAILIDGNSRIAYYNFFQALSVLNFIDHKDSYDTVLRRLNDNFKFTSLLYPSKKEYDECGMDFVVNYYFDPKWLKEDILKNPPIGVLDAVPGNTPGDRALCRDVVQKIFQRIDSNFLNVPDPKKTQLLLATKKSMADRILRPSKNGFGYLLDLK